MGVGFVGSGCLFIDRLASDGSQTGYKRMGNSTKFAIKPDAEKKERISKQCDSYGQVLGTVVVPKPTTLSVTMDEWDRETVAMALFGDAAVKDISAGSVTDEQITAHHDAVSFLAHRDVSSVVVTNSDGSTTYTAGDDYTVDTERGAITVLSSGAISNGDSLLVDYSYGAEKYVEINGSTSPIIKCRFLLDGINQETGKKCRVEVLEAVLSPSGEVDFLADDFSALEFEATLNTPDGAGAPYTVNYYDGV